MPDLIPILDYAPIFARLFLVFVAVACVVLGGNWFIGYIECRAWRQQLNTPPRATRARGSSST